MRSFIIKPGDLIPIGRAGENQATQIRFDVTGWADTFGAGTYTLVVKRPHEDTAYPVEVTVDGDYVVWTVSNVDTGIAGNASVQLRYVVDGALAKSVIYTGIVGESLDNIVDPPDPFEDLIQRMVDLAERTEAAAESAAGSAGTATTAAEAAQTAKTAAETAANQAQSAKEAAQASATTATQAKEAAQTAQTGAGAAQAAAAQSATAASGSATAAAGSAAQAAASATAADASAAAAAQSAAAAQAAAMDVIDKAPVITDTASGAIASFPDGSAAPIKQLTVKVNPVQDLHGYDNPWPAGGGKNKLPLKFYGGVGYNVDAGTVFDTATEYTDGTVSGNKVTFTVGGWGRRCMLSDRLISGESYYISMEVTSANLRFTWYTLDADLKTVRKYEVTGSGTSKTVRNPVTMSETECYIAIYLGSSVQGDISYTEPQIEVGNAKTNFAPYENLCPITGWTGAEVTVSPTLDAQDGQTYPISWQSEAGTVYGGNLTVNQDGSADLVADTVTFNLAEQTWTYYNTAGRNTFNCSLYYANYDNPFARCDRYVFDPTIHAIASQGNNSMIYYKSGSGNVRLSICDNRFTSAGDFVASLTGVEFVYRHKEPVTYTLTAAEMTTLFGQNNWWADCGDVSVEYRADTKLYIDKKLAALLAALS